MNAVISFFFILLVVIGIATFKALFDLKKLIRKIKLRWESNEERARAIKRIFLSWASRSDLNQELENYHWLNGRIVRFLKRNSSFYLCPIFFLRVSLVYLTTNVKILWKLPISLYEVWDMLLLYLAYELLATKPIWSLVILCVIFTHHILSVFDFFNPNKKTIKFYFKLPHKLTVGGLFHSYFVFILCYAVIYAYLSSDNKIRVSDSLGGFDYVYLSTTVMTTVGFGEIYPVGSSARVIFTSQMILGILMNLIFVSAFMGLWLSLKNDKKD